MIIKTLPLLLILSLLLSACGSENTPIKKAYQPIEKKNPKFYFTVKGYIDPKLKNKVSTVWTAKYFTKNPKCKVIINSFEGVDSALYKSFNYLPAIDKTGNFKLTIPIDRFKPGICKWAIYQVGYVMKTKYQTFDGANTGVGLEKNKEPVLNFEQIYSCRKKQCSLIKDGLNKPKKYAVVSKTRNHIFYFYIKEGTL